MIRSIAFVTPWPPNVMGIGETCFALVKELSQISPYRFSVYTNAVHPTQIPGVTIQTLPLNWRGKIDVAAAVKNFRRHDLIVHHVGNSSAHAFQWPLLEAFPAVCHFHDLIYHHFWVWYYFNYLKKPRRYYRELFRFYPELKLQFKKGITIWDHIDLNAYPLFEPHMEKSLGCIVHSDWNKNSIQKAFPNRAVHRFSLHKGHLTPQNVYQPSDQLRFGIFGSVLPNKQVDVIVQTLAKLDSEFPNWHLTLVGPMAESCQFLYTRVKELNIENKVTLMGKVEKTLYLEQLNQIDCCLNLRFPSFGESSGVVTECLILGIPVLVADLMWYSELPSFVDKIAPNHLENALYSTLRHYFLHPEILTEKKQLSKAYANQHLSYRGWVKNYLQILDEFCSHSCATR